MIAIIDYDAGNLTSVARALSHLGFACTVTHDLKTIEQADRIIFPGVGAAGSAMASIRRLGVDRCLKEAFAAGKPILGICVGTQVILEYSEENDTPCLGLIPGRVRAFSQELRSEGGQRLKVPHMGWNRVHAVKAHPILKEIQGTDAFYFVHGYYPEPRNGDWVIGETDYGVSFASVMGKGNLFATQFHPEKSGRPGLSILRRFCRWDGVFQAQEAIPKGTVPC